LLATGFYDRVHIALSNTKNVPAHWQCMKNAPSTRSPRV
jgi:hypothetical protein